MVEKIPYKVYLKSGNIIEGVINLTDDNNKEKDKEIVNTMFKIKEIFKEHIMNENNKTYISLNDFIIRMESIEAINFSFREVEEYLEN